MHSFDHLTLGSLNNSANFIFGLTGGDLWTPEFDVQNNPYVEVMGLEMANGNKIEFYNRYELEICSEDHLSRFLPEFVRHWYAQPLCFKDRDNVPLYNSWWYREYSNPTIGYFYCKNTTENNNWCKTPDEIDDWLAVHIQYFMHQETRFSAEIWANHPLVDEHPYFGDEDNYFPTIKSFKSYNYGQIVNDRTRRQDVNF